MKISARTYLVGNAWKNWRFVRVDTDEGIHGVGEGALNASSAAVETAVQALRDEFIGLDPSQVVLHLLAPGWERRDDAPMPALDLGS